MYAFSISNKVILSIILLFFHFNLISESVRIFEYDKNSQLIKEQQASGELIAYEYDSSGRIIRKRTSDDSVIEFDYDKNGNCISMTDCQGITSYTYDLLSRLTAVSFPGRNTIYYKYNILGNLEEMVYPNGMKVTYQYDSLNRLVLSEIKQESQVMNMMIHLIP